MLQDVDVREVLEDSLRLIAHWLRDVAIERDYAEVSAVPGRAGELAQVWTNILSNAVDALAGAGAGAPAAGAEDAPDGGAGVTWGRTPTRSETRACPSRRSIGCYEPSGSITPSPLQIREHLGILARIIAQPVILILPLVMRRFHGVRMLFNIGRGLGLDHIHRKYQG